MSTKPVHAMDLFTGKNPRVTETMNRELMKSITSEEIRDPGAYGMMGHFSIILGYCWRASDKKKSKFL